MSDQIPPMKRKRGRPSKPPKVCDVVRWKVNGKPHFLVIYTDGRAGMWPPSPDDPDKPVTFPLTPVVFKMP